MPLLGDLEMSHSFVDANEAEVIVNEYFSYIEEFGLAFENLGHKDLSETKTLEISDIVESISNRLERSCEPVV